MAEKREHHFVPQFYLRKFSNDDRSINLFNISRESFIAGASIKGQCSRRRFYGPDATIEDALGDIERDASRILAKVDEDKVLPLPHSSEMEVLLTFIALQKGRGMSAARANNEQTDALAKLYFEGDPDFPFSQRDDVKLENIYPALLPLQIMTEFLPLILTLGAHIFVNRSGTDFICSDDPLITHNQFCEGIDYQGVLGMNSAGIQIFLPISPDTLILLYDKSVYTVGKTRKETTTPLSSKDAIDNLNGFQILNATHNIYFKSINQQRYVRGSFDRFSPSRRPVRSRVVRTERVVVDGEESELVHVYEPLLENNITVSDIRIRRNMRRIPLHSRSTLRRYDDNNPESTPPQDGRSIRYPIRKTT